MIISEDTTLTRAKTTTEVLKHVALRMDAISNGLDILATQHETDTMALYKVLSRIADALEAIAES